jgi:hypothetical protein
VGITSAFPSLRDTERLRNDSGRDSQGSDKEGALLLSDKEDGSPSGDASGKITYGDKMSLFDHKGASAMSNKEGMSPGGDANGKLPLGDKTQLLDEREGRLR